MQATSTIQGNPLAIMDGSLNNSHGGFNPSPVSEYGVNSLTLIALLIHTYMQTQLFFTSNSLLDQKLNTIRRSSSYEELNGTAPPVNATHVSPFPKSTQAQLGMQERMMGVPDVTYCRNFAPSSAVREPRKSPEYKCRYCDATFDTSQAYGGHMSGHSKNKHKIPLDD
jgi:hypothetical protein